MAVGVAAAIPATLGLLSVSRAPTRFHPAAVFMYLAYAIIVGIVGGTFLWKQSVKAKRQEDGDPR
jgi:hypothetical protein